MIILKDNKFLIKTIKKNTLEKYKKTTEVKNINKNYLESCCRCC